MEQMIDKFSKVVLLLLLIGVSIFAVSQYISISKDKEALTSTLEDTKKSLSVSETERQRLLTELEQEKALHQQLLNENDELREKVRITEERVAQLSQEHADISARLTSIPELKKAIREIKQETLRLRREMKEQARTDTALDGNLGFLVRDGKSTYPARVKIEVIPAPPQN